MSDQALCVALNGLYMCRRNGSDKIYSTVLSSTGEYGNDSFTMGKRKESLLCAAVGFRFWKRITVAYIETDSQPPTQYCGHTNVTLVRCC